MAVEHRIQAATGIEVLVVVAENGEEAGKLAADRAAAALRAGRGNGEPFVLGLPAGRSAVPFYSRLVALYAVGKVSFRQAASFNLDEYLGLPPFHPGSFRRFMDERFFDHVDFIQSRVHLLDGLTRDPEGTCARYEEAIRAAGGIDLQVLGIGRNGHIAFNEPGTPPASRTRRVSLAEETREYNAPFFGGRNEVPPFALTMGIGTILDARRICLLAHGEAKAEAVRASLLDPPCDALPASHLQAFAGEVTYVLDEKASRTLFEGDA